MDELQTDDRGYLVVPSEYRQAWEEYTAEDDDADDESEGDEQRSE